MEEFSGPGQTVRSAEGRVNIPVGIRDSDIRGGLWPAVESASYRPAVSNCPNLLVNLSHLMAERQFAAVCPRSWVSHADACPLADDLLCPSLATRTLPATNQLEGTLKDIRTALVVARKRPGRTST